MSWYARPSWQLVRQVSADAFVVVWAVVWWLVARFVDQVVSALAGPAREAAATATQLQESFRGAAQTAGQVPGVGGDLRSPFDAAAEQLGGLAGTARGQAVLIEQLGDLTGVLVFVLPVAILVALWLPRRLRFAARSRAARRFVDSPADLDLFALRAMATMPLDQLAKISDDPVAAWRAGDRQVIASLAETALRREGLPPLRVTRS
ncbi:hypothetical protein [Auraticoccus monumenti]|uniref:Uncharacterized protein n=1 Tax=Auraticoccus monumenti TaxID=675864 RepID=A0A1G7D208_9ACTN|nr:hypothetical protein [Auraticoccus monumenti]SDE45559.1 hypothetical protein SAMN04489747_3460 [Auraticoccus monumenti]